MKETWVPTVLFYYWLFNRDPYNGFWYSLYNWVGLNPKNITLRQPGALFSWNWMVFSGKDFTLMRERNNGISPCLIGNTSSKGPFSNAMLDYRSVPEMFGDLESRGFLPSDTCRAPDMLIAPRHRSRSAHCHRPGHWGPTFRIAGYDVSPVCWSLFHPLNGGKSLQMGYVIFNSLTNLFPSFLAHSKWKCLWAPTCVTGDEDGPTF